MLKFSELIIRKYVYNLKATPKKCLELKTLLGSTPKFETILGAYKEEEGLHANFKVE
jgi:hypothetical protein